MEEITKVQKQERAVLVGLNADCFTKEQTATDASLEELDAALAEAFAYNGPFLIECPMDKDELVLPMVRPGGSMGDIITRIGD